MIEIKFRAWDVNRREMIYGVMGGGRYNENDDTYGLIMQYSNAGTLGKFKLLQGLLSRDRKGKEFYIADIIKGFYKGGETAISVIKRSRDDFGIVGIDLYEKNSIFNPSHCEIIGNIYQNPELQE